MEPLSFPLGRNISESVTPLCLSAKTPNKQKPKHYPPFNWFHQAFCHRDKKSNYIPVSLVPDRGRVVCHMWGKEKGNFTHTSLEMPLPPSIYQLAPLCGALGAATWLWAAFWCTALFSPFDSIFLEPYWQVINTVEEQLKAWHIANILPSIPNNNSATLLRVVSLETVTWRFSGCHFSAASKDLHTILQCSQLMALHWTWCFGVHGWARLESTHSVPSWVSHGWSL